MSLLAASLLVCRTSNDATATRHRDLPSLRESWFRARQVPEIVGVLTIGFTEVEARVSGVDFQLLQGCLLGTAAAVHCLPSELRQHYETPVGKLGDDELFLLRANWGYSVSFPHLEKVASAERRSSGEVSRGWVDRLPDIGSSDLKETLAVERIFDDDTYLRHEIRLEHTIRTKTGILRFSLLSGRKLDQASVLANVRWLPPWALSRSISDLGLTPVLTNQIVAAGIDTVADFDGVSSEELTKLPRVGKAAIHRISFRILEAVLNGPDPLVGTPSEADLNAELGRRSTSSRSTFVEDLRDAIDALPAVWAKIILLRSGMETGKRHTLEEVGDAARLTRERVRQIEKNSIKRFETALRLPTLFRAHLSSVLNGRLAPTPVAGLAHLDPWFKGLAANIPMLDYFLDKLVENTLFVVSIDSIDYVSSISQSEWDKRVRDARRVVQDNSGQGKSLKEVRDLALGQLEGKGLDLKTEFWHEVSKAAIFSGTGEHEQDILVGYGDAAHAFSIAILEDSPTPLHYSEVTRKANARFGKHLDDRRVHADLYDRALLFGRGTYGLSKHFPLTSDESRMLVEYLEQKVTETDVAARQWHALELLEILEGSGLDFLFKVDHYVISIALSDSLIFRNLGRQVWTIKPESSDQTEPRLAIYQAVLQILWNAKKPLQLREIMTELWKYRGTNAVLQFGNDRQIYKISRSTYGLFERDLPTDIETLELFSRILAERIRSSGQGIHISEVPLVIQNSGLINADFDDYSFVFHHLIVVYGYRLSRGDYLYSSDWDDCRRLTPRQVVEQVINSAGDDGILIDELYVEVRRVLGRDIPNGTVGQMASLVGEHNKDDLRWRPVRPDQGAES